MTKVSKSEAVMNGNEPRIYNSQKLLGIKLLATQTSSSALSNPTVMLRWYVKYPCLTCKSGASNQCIFLQLKNLKNE